MKLRRILAGLVMLALAGVLGWQLSEARPAPAIVVRYLEPPARGTGRLALTSCELRVQDGTGKTIAEREVPANAAGGVTRTVRIGLSSRQIADAHRVLAACTDGAGRTGESTTYALAPTREPVTRVANQAP